MKTQNILMLLIVIGFTVQSYGQSTVCQRVATTSVNTSQFQDEWNTAQATLFDKMYACSKIPQHAFGEMLQDRWIIACKAQKEKSEFDKASQVLIDLYSVIHTACVKHVAE